MDARTAIAELAPIIGGVVGMVGAVLGIFNTWVAHSRNRVRLRVVPGVEWRDEVQGLSVITINDYVAEKRWNGQPPRWIGIEIINLSTFAVTIDDVGFGRYEGLRASITKPIVNPQRTMPVRLESRESTRITAPANQVFGEDTLVQQLAYARTACGKVVYGRSPALQRLFMTLLNKASV